MAPAADGGLVAIGHVDALGSCNYRHLPIPPSTPTTVTAIWRSEVVGTGPLYVVPDCCVEVVRSLDGTVEVWGPAVTVRCISLDRGMAFDGIRLRVGAGHDVIGLPADAMAGQVLGAADLPLARRLQTHSRATWFAWVLRLASDGELTWTRDSVAVTASAMLSQPRVTIPNVAERLDLRERQFRRRFRRSVGVSPAAYRRLSQTLLAIRDIHGGPATARIADIAHQRGFTDQAHLTHAVVSLTGTTPATLRRLAQPACSGPVA